MTERVGEPRRADVAGPDDRLAAHRSVAAVLDRLSDADAAAAVTRGERLGTGIGGASWRTELAGQSVFVKQVPVNAVEASPGQQRRTNNPFGLPAYCHYGVGSPGLNVWRELAAHERANGWILDGAAPGFPLLHGWRLVTAADLAGHAATPIEAGEIDALVAFWHDASGLRRRLQANAAAERYLLLFLEYLPWTLRAWLTARLADGPAAVDQALPAVANELLDTVSAMNAAGLWHFDSHLDNVLTDGRRAHLADFGLALAADFEATDHERAFLARNRAHDLAYTATQCVNWAVQAFVEVADPAARNAVVHEAAQGEPPEALPPAIRAFVRRFAPVATVTNDVYWGLHGERRDRPFPAAAVEGALARAGVAVPDAP